MAIALILGAGSIFFFAQGRQNRSLVENQLQGEAERMHDLALCHLIEELHKKSYDLDSIKRQWHTETGPVTGKDDRWVATYNFVLVDQDKKALDKKKDLHSVRVDVTIDLKCIDMPRMQPIRFPHAYRFCLRTS